MENLYNTYKKHMTKELEHEDFDALQTRIMRAARKKQTGSAKTYSRRRVLRGAVAGACAFAVACGGIFIGSTVGVPQASNKAGRSASAAVQNDNWFCLTAYAAGSKNVAVPAVAAKNIVGIKGMDFGGGENIADFGHQRVIEDFNFNLNCQGQNLKELKYTISGNTKFSISKSKPDEGSTANFNNPYKYLPAEKTFSSFTAKPGEDLSKYRIHCVAPITAKEELALHSEKYGKKPDGTAYTPEEMKKITEQKSIWVWDPTLPACEEIEQNRLNQHMSGTIISITATFNDGTFKTLRYQLSVAKDYLEGVRQLNKEDFELEKSFFAAPDANGVWRTKMTALTEKEKKDYNAALEKVGEDIPSPYCISELK
ncbi:MAG: hypothetical protein LKF71_03745 [Oscillospiraceae bacterium]|jgi:hypothetical protein|nr:hypothetical protein [Oscillospiraceae bacterium]